MESHNEFTGKTVLVTGSGRGIGRAIALHYAQLGANVAINYFRNPAPAVEVAAEIRSLGQESVAIKANVGELDQLSELFDRVDVHFGGIDIYIHNAASGYNRPIMEQRPRGWEWTMNINTRSFLFACREAAQRMRDDGGSIVALSSMGSQRVLPEYSVVGASKAALESLVRYAAVELAPNGIRVNAVSPGVVETDALQHFEALRQSEDSADESSVSPLVEEMRQATPAGRLCTPLDVAQLVAFLSSSQASMIRGQTIVVDGGYSLLV